MQPESGAEESHSRTSVGVGSGFSSPNTRGSPLSDEALAESAIEDRSAYIELYHRYVNGVHSYFAWKFGRVVAEDLVSETFTRALNSLHRFDAGRSWKAWLFGIARHVSREHARRRAREPVTTSDPIEVISESPGPETAAIDSERVAFTRALVAGLSAGDREALELRFWAGLSYREVAAVMGTSEGAARVRVHRSLQKLKSQLEIRK